MESSYSSYLAIIIVVTSALISIGLTGNITVTPAIQLKEIGQNAVFHCNATDLWNTTLTWYNEQTNQSLTNRSSKAGSSVIVNYEIGGSSTLTITNVTSLHNTRYICRASGLQGSVKATGVLLVRFCETRRLLPADRKPLIIRTKLGMNVSLACPLYGFPPPAITWTHPSGRNKTKVSSNILYITANNKTSMGLYSCSGCAGERFDFQVNDYMHDQENGAEESKEEANCQAYITSIAVLAPVLVLVIIILVVLLLKVKWKQNSAEVTPQE